MQPLFEHRLHVDGHGTRALELEGDGPGLMLLPELQTSPTCAGCPRP